MAHFYTNRGRIPSMRSGQPGINAEEYKSLKINLPSLPEQEKIATFLSKVDEKIEKLERKKQLWKEYKKGVMQKIFSQEIRFKDDEGKEFPEWEKVHLNKICNRVTRKNKNLESTLPLTISAQHGLVDQETFFNKIVASKNLENYYLLQKGEFSYNKSYSKGYPLGAIKRLDLYEKGVLSSLYICFSLNSNMNSNYMVQYFETNKWHKEVSMIAVEGARNHGLLNISVNDFFNIFVKVPSLSEQEKIASFLFNLDNKIEVLEKEIKQNKEFKKGLLQGLFV